MFCSADGAEIFQIVFTTCKFEIDCKLSIDLISRMQKQGENITDFVRTLAKIYNRHFQTARKFRAIYK